MQKSPAVIVALECARLLLLSSLRRCLVDCQSMRGTWCDFGELFASIVLAMYSDSQPLCAFPCITLDVELGETFLASSSSGE